MVRLTFLYPLLEFTAAITAFVYLFETVIAKVILIFGKAPTLHDPFKVPHDIFKSVIFG